jgi:hypothetical protein
MQTALESTSNLDVPRVRQEPLESRKHIVSDEIVYGCDVVISNVNPRPNTFEWLSKYKAGLAWFEANFFFKGQVKHQITAVIEVNDGIAIGRENVERSVHRAHRENSVLVQIANIVQLPKGMLLKPIPSRVWLKQPDLLYGLTRNVPDNLPENRFAFGVFPVVNREAGFPSRIGGGEQGKLPCQLVERGAERVSEVPQDKGRTKWDGFQFKPDDVPRILNIVCFRNGVWFGREIFINDFLERVELILRPSGLGYRII